MPPKTQQVALGIVAAVFVVGGFVALLNFWGDMGEPTPLDSQLNQNSQEADESQKRIDEAKRKAQELRERKQP